jgi:hypothetical protein
MGRQAGEREREKLFEFPFSFILFLNWKLAYTKIHIDVLHFSNYINWELSELKSQYPTTTTTWAASILYIFYIIFSAMLKIPLPPKTNKFQLEFVYGRKILNFQEYFYFLKMKISRLIN